MREEGSRLYSGSEVWMKDFKRWYSRSMRKIWLDIRAITGTQIFSPFGIADPRSLEFVPTLPVLWCLRKGRGPNLGELAVESVLLRPWSDEAPEAS